MAVTTCKKSWVPLPPMSRVSSKVEKVKEAIRRQIQRKLKIPAAIPPTRAIIVRNIYKQMGWSDEEITFWFEVPLEYLHDRTPREYINSLTTQQFNAIVEGMKSQL